MKISVYGNRMPALVTAAVLADVGNDVLLVAWEPLLEPEDFFKAAKVEPALRTMMMRQHKSGRLRFSSQLQDGVDFAEIQINVMRPERLDTAKELAAMLGESAHPDVIFVNRSTFPIGASEEIQAIVEQRGKVQCHLVVEPDFMTEGRAVSDFTRPDRILLGSTSEKAIRIMRDIYRPFNRNRDVVMTMAPRAAELAKFATNAMLATRISFMNEMAEVADKFNIDIEQVRQGLGSDGRIGYDFLYPGSGFGGPNFARDVDVLAKTVAKTGLKTELLNAVLHTNEIQKEVLFRKAWQFFNMDLRGRTFAIWGVTYKAGTDQVTQSPAIPLVKALLAQGAQVKIYDPAGMENFMEEMQGSEHLISPCESPYAALEGASALMVNTDWKEFWSPDFERIRSSMAQPVIFDGRNLYEPAQIKTQGITYFGIGRR